MSIQREGTLAITGGLQTSPMDSLDVHASMLPMKLRVGKICHNSAVRIASLPHTHPLHKSIRRAARRQVKRHRARHGKNRVSDRRVKMTNESVYLIVGGWETEDELIVARDEAYKGQTLEDRDGRDLS